MNLRKRYLVLSLGLLSGLACQQEEKIDERVIPEEVVSGSFMVESIDTVEGDKKEALKAALTPIASSMGCSLEGPTEILWEHQERALPITLNNSFHIKFNDCNLSQEQTDQLLTQMLSLDEVQTAEAEAVLKASLSENDPYKSRQYYHTNIRRNEACDVSSKQGKPVVVAVVDSGVQFNHPDLVDRFYRDGDGQVIGANFVGKGSYRNPDNNWDDSNGHGTHVAGLIAATGNNGKGITGVASCKNVLIMPIRVMGSNGTGSSIEIDRGIQWAAAKGADIINLSLGSNSYAYRSKSSHKKSLYENLAEQGVIVFAAAGNDGFRNGSSTRNGYIYSYPASYDNVIAVGATNQRDRLTNFSVYGDLIDIAAPGEQTLSTYPGSSYKYLSGTSMATPIAVGAYALALSEVRSKGSEYLFHSELMPILAKTANKRGTFGSSEIATAGLVDANALVAALQERFPSDDTGTPAPTNPMEPGSGDDNGSDPEEPAPTPGEGFRFVGLQDGQTISASGLRIQVAGWPENTARIYLYWITGNEWFPRSFTSLGRENLGNSGDVVTTESTYVLYGTKYLVAEAKDSYGRRLGTQQVLLKGLDR
ncbi:S8 family peptidase [Pseudobacteriovorax antillogorgiicola]|uniref:Subtilase family protein n=1 Tax=Pseudobacteriovorax antillogorgiicola TaxID=1513793 RepID=A0A1Y6B6W8_9BACT|nr:S8 family serine peptidase [Pseudobacteriovorax antillogorgiicola]TCS58686.1 subtilase family protein [Pseudobacteriovorax antillogorgiicola]SME95842.1 Subtilase family protein [Pseudobacteriovorax antillogorgiicola]